MEGINWKRVGRYGISVVAAGLGGLIIYTGVEVYRRSHRTYQAALKTLNPAEVKAWVYGEFVSLIRRKYCLFSYKSLSKPYQPLSFNEFWEAMSKPAADGFQSMAVLAECGGVTVSELRDHVLYGTFRRLPCPLPRRPLSIPAACFVTSIFLTVPLAIGMGAQHFLRDTEEGTDG